MDNISMMLSLRPLPQEVAVVYSGGLDSTVLVSALRSRNHKVTAICFNDGSAFYSQRERVSIVESLRMIGGVSLVEIPFVDSDLLASSDELGYMPGYKMLMQTVAMSYCSAKNIPAVLFGNISDNCSYKDESEKGMRSVASCFSSLYGKKVEVFSPWRKASKVDTVKLGLKLGSPLGSTLSCRNPLMPSVLHCGVCKQCRSRAEAFATLRVEDPALYWKG